jgi:hypothetical protein
MTENERFGLVFAKTGSINSSTGDESEELEGGGGGIRDGGYREEIKE